MTQSAVAAKTGGPRASAGKVAKWLVDKGRTDEAVALLAAWAVTGPNDAAGQPHVVDFGLARLLREEAEQDPRADQHGPGQSAGPLTDAGMLMGTADFIAPEQVTNPTGVDGRADIYSLGCSLYYVLTGQVPFPGGTSQQKIRRHLNETPALISDLNPTIPVGFAKLVEQLAPDTSSPVHDHRMVIARLTPFIDLGVRGRPPKNDLVDL